MRECSHTLVINAPPAAVLNAFFEHEALAVWWEVTRAICIPRPLGGYALEWMPTFVADLYWHPPDGDAIGPMALEVTCRVEGAVTRLHIRQSGYDKDSPRWTRYYDVMTAGWEGALMTLKHYLEKRWA